MPVRTCSRIPRIMYQPATRRPYGVLEWPAMMRLLDAEERSSGFPSYRQ